MKQTEYSTRVLSAEEGMKLTQTVEVDLKDRVVSDEIYLAATDAPENWKEITAEEGEAIREEQRKLLV